MCSYIIYLLSSRDIIWKVMTQLQDAVNVISVAKFPLLPKSLVVRRAMIAVTVELRLRDVNR